MVKEPAGYDLPAAGKVNSISARQSGAVAAKRERRLMVRMVIVALGARPLPRL